jgi:hypothetical protein
MRARTIGQIAALMMAHTGGTTATPGPSLAPSPTKVEPATVADEVDFEALSSDEIDQLIGDDEDPLIEVSPHV